MSAASMAKRWWVSSPMAWLKYAELKARGQGWTRLDTVGHGAAGLDGTFALSCPSHVSGDLQAGVVPSLVPPEVREGAVALRSGGYDAKEHAFCSVDGRRRAVSLRGDT